MPTGATLTTLTNILKEYYLPPVVEQLNNEVLLLQRLEARDQELFGKAAFVPVHTGRSSGVGARGENVQLPDAGNQTYARAQYDLKYLYGRVRVTGPSMAKTQDEAGAFLQSLKAELDGIRNDLKKDTSRQVYGTGDGIIATCGSSGPSTTVTLASAEAIRKGQLYVNQIVDIGTIANPQVITAATTISAVNIGTPSITVGASVTVTGANFIFRAGSSTASATYEMSGLQQMVSTAANTFGGIDSTAAGNQYWDNLRDTSGGVLANLDKLMQGWNQVRIAGGEVSVVITSFGLQRTIFNILQSQVRYTEPMKLAGGFSALTFMDQPIVADLDAPFGNLFFLDERFIKVFSNRDWHFLDEDGTILKWTVGYDMWEAVLARYMNLGATRRNVLFRMSGLTDATGF